MLLLVLCVLLCTGGAVCEDDADEEVVSALFGAHGDNRCGVCVGERAPRRCVGALWRERWALATDSCLRGAPPSALLVVRDFDAVTCDEIVKKRYNNIYTPQARGVLARLPHPSGNHDLVLLPLDRPFTFVDNLANTSAVDRALKIVEPWLNIDINSYQVAGLSAYPRAMVSTPLRMMFTTILLPTFSFLAFFMFVVFCTGREPIPYQSLDEKSDSNYGV